VRRVFVADSAQGLDGLVADARKQGIPVVSVERRRLEEMAADRHHQGVLAEAAPFRYVHLDDLVAQTEPALLLVLDSLQDPQNFGTLLRTAQACGVRGVIIQEHRAVGITPAVASASAGAIEHLPIARVTNLARSLEQLEARNVWVYGLTVDAERPFWDVDWTTPSALVVGSESTGIGRLVRERCDQLIGIPMQPDAVQSLNAATAGSLVIYEAFRQRQSSR
jgi:23S rRNA (guanosine2251-2'-O)-methyltransferase